MSKAYKGGDPRAQQLAAYLSTQACDFRLSTAKLDAQAELEAQWAADKRDTAQQSKSKGLAGQLYTTTPTAGLKRPVKQMNGTGFLKQMRAKIFTHVRAYSARKAGEYMLKVQSRSSSDPIHQLNG